MRPRGRISARHHATRDPAVLLRSMAGGSAELASRQSATHHVWTASRMRQGPFCKINRNRNKLIDLASSARRWIVGVQRLKNGEDRTFSPALKLDGLSDQQKKEVESQSRPNAALIHETIRAEGESELQRTAWALTLSGLAAGLSMGFSLVVQGELHANLPPGPVRVLLTPMGYTVGFLIVVLGRQQLFTENTLTPILPLLHNRDLSTLRRVVRLWALVLTANIVGTWLFAA